MNATRGTASPDTVPIRIPAQPGPPEAERGPARRRRRLARAAGAYWRSVALLVPVLAVAGAVTGWNLQGWPGRADDDEGTYVAEAWAMLTEHHLSHYTYWYDHPPLGWGQIALFGWVTDGFHRVSSEVMLGREFMWCLTLAGCTALFVTCRRLGLRRVTAAAAATLFAVSPLALWYHRMVSLDNIAVVWLLAALAIAASRRRSLGAAFWSAVALAIGILSKETTVILAPVVVCVLWQHTRRQTRWWNLGIFGVTLSLLLAGYPLFAALRNELLPGRGHVSLLWSLWWQFIARAGSGSPLTASSASHWLLNLWLELDPWLLGAGLALAAPALAVRRLRPVAFALLIQVLVPMKGGYLPYFYVTAMLPFAAALVAGAGEALWLWFAGPRTRWIGRAVVAACALAFAAGVAPQWWGELSAQARLERDTASLAATRWVERNVPPRAVVVVDDYIWLDLKLRGLNPLWMWKVDGDPRVSAVDLEHGWRSIGYVVVTPQAAELLSQMPVLNAAVEHSVVLANFGQGVTVRQVLSGPVAPEATAAALQPPPPEPGPPTRVRSPLIGR